MPRFCASFPSCRRGPLSGKSHVPWPIAATSTPLAPNLLNRITLLEPALEKLELVMQRCVRKQAAAQVQ